MVSVNLLGYFETSLAQIFDDFLTAFKDHLLRKICCVLLFGQLFGKKFTF